MAVDPRAELEKLIREHGEDYASLSRMIGRNPAYIQQFIKRGTPQRLSEEDRSRLASYFRIAEDRLGGRAAPVARDVNEAGGRTADILRVPRVEISASAGPGKIAEIEPQGPPVAFDGPMLREIAGASLAELSIIRVSGDSMEPTLADGDDILVDLAISADPPREGIYVIRFDDMLMVKRLVADDDASRRFIIRSDNPRHADIGDYDPASLRLIGRVLWAGRRLA